MFKKLDLYIIKKYLATFFYTALIFSMITLIIDFSERVEDFIEKPITRHEIIFDYYINYIPYINSLLWPLYALIAVIFFTSRLAFNSEIISMLGAGMSFKRILQPYLIAGTLIMGIHLIGNHTVIPKGNKDRVTFENTYLYPGNVKSRTNDIHMFIGPQKKVYIRFFSKRDTTARDFRIETFEGSQLTNIIKARRAEWLGPPNKWRLHNYEIRQFDGMNETFIDGRNEKLDTTFNLYPSDFVRFSNQKEMMTTAELKSFIDAERKRGLGHTKIYEIEMHRRSAEPITVLILTIIGVAVASRKVRGGMGLHLAIGIALGAIYIFLSKFSTTFATNKAIPTMLGVWIPNLIFIGVAFFLYKKAQR